MFTILMIFVCSLLNIGGHAAGSVVDPRARTGVGELSTGRESNILLPDGTKFTLPDGTKFTLPDGTK